MDEQFTFTLFSKEPIIISIDDKNIYHIDNSNVFFATITTIKPEVMIQVIQDHEPQSFLIQAISDHGSKKDDYTIIKRNNKEFDVYLHPQPRQSSIKEIAFHHQDKDTSFVVTKGPVYECCYQDHCIPCGYCYFDECDHFQCNHLGNFYYLICTKPNYTFIIVVDTSMKEIVYSHEVDEYQFTSDAITLLQSINDYYHHALVTKFTNNQKEEYFVFTDRKVDELKEEILVPEVFLECIACEDYTNALTYLSKDLKPTSEHLKQFFGKIQEIFYAGTSHDKICYVVKTDKSFNRYEFSITSFKITNIE